MAKNTLPECPECDKLHAVADKSQVCGEFLDWLKGQFFLAKPHEHTDDCGYYEGSCGYRRDELEPVHENTESLLARFFNIDMKKVEKEKSARLDAIRATNKF